MKVENLCRNTEDFTGNVWLVRRNSKEFRGSQKPETVSSSETVLVDAGTGDCWKNIEKLESVDKVVLTHSHHDHVDNLPRIKDLFSPEIYAYEPDNLPVNSKRLEEGDTVKFGDTEFEVFHTPGHKDDSICLYSKKEKMLFAGDLLFPEGSFGRTDLEEGDRDLLIQSIEKIAELDVEKMYCGHDEAVLSNANSQIQESLEAAKKKEPKY